jgi:FtsH-binding integral membrane protein
MADDDKERLEELGRSSKRLAIMLWSVGAAIIVAFFVWRTYVFSWISGGAFLIALALGFIGYAFWRNGPYMRR